MGFLGGRKKLLDIMCVTLTRELNNESFVALDGSKCNV